MKVSVIVWIAIGSMAAMIAAELWIIYEIATEIMFAFGLLLDAYVGTDQIAGVMRTRTMPAGEKFCGNRAKLFAIVYATLALTFECFFVQILSLMSGKSVDTPAMECFLIFLTASVLLAAGEKTKTAFECVDGAPKKGENNEQKMDAK